MSRGSRWRHVPFGGLALPVVALGLAVVAAGGMWRTHHTIGLALLVPSAALWAVSRVQLGDASTTRPEARVLEAAFGDAYRAYRRRTWW